MNTYPSKFEYTYLRLFAEPPRGLEYEPVEDAEDGERDPVVADDKAGVEDGILEELHHALPRGEVAEADEVLPPEDAYEEEDGRDGPSHSNHRHHLATSPPTPIPGEIYQRKYYVLH